MAELSLMASAALSPGAFHQDPVRFRPPPKDFQPLMASHGKRQKMVAAGGMQMEAPHFEDPWKFSSLIADNQLVLTTPVIEKPVLIDVQDTRPDSVLFSFGVAEQCHRHEQILKFLTSNSNMTDGNELNMSIISELMGYQNVNVDMCQQAHVPTDYELCLSEVATDDSQKVIHPPQQLYAPRSILEFVANLSNSSSITVHPNGQVLFSGSTTEMKDLLSIVAEFNLSKTSQYGGRKATVVPYFTRRRGGHVRVNGQESTAVFHPVTGPSDSTLKSKTTQKKKQTKIHNPERFSKNYFYACDCLFNAYLDQTGNKMTVLSLKESRPELTQLLSQVSAAVVGAGLAVLISVACKVMNGNLALLASAKALNITFGLGLFWVASAVNKLRETIYHLSKRSARTKKLNDELTILQVVRRSMNEILFRFVALMVVGAMSI